ncbi:MAG: isoprenyl transferase [Coriobacteriia bacterium]|nr:isoprenyl transferase [Coriobacteriia bacterium]
MPKPSLTEFFSSTRAIGLLSQLDAERVPRHVAIIMDGNGRWAERRSLPRVAGHRAGAKAIEEILAAAIETGVRYLTIYSFSTENWRRSDEEVNALMALFVEVLKAKLGDLMDQGVRVRVIGRLEEMPPATERAFRDTMDKTRDNDTLELVVALNYGARSEIADAAQAIAREVAAGTLGVADVDEECVAAHLYTVGVPDPDLLIRTSGEMRISNFLLWQIAYSELLITDVLWPDFDRDEFLAALVDFQSRDRRFGGR